MARALILGCGYAGTAIARRAVALGDEVIATVRTPRAIDGVDVRAHPALDAAIVAPLAAEAHVVVTFPPDGRTDEAIAPALTGARSVVYLSATSVYDSGLIDDATPVTERPSPRAARRLAAEARYRGCGATILRCPAIYGRDRGLHVRAREGKHRIPGDGAHRVSRIHVEDLASLAIAARAVRDRTYVVGDAEPAPHLDVVRYICARYGLPLPPHAPLDEVDETLRSDRRVDASRALAELGVTLRYPSYRDGIP